MGGAWWLIAGGLLALDDGETGCGDRAGQSESVAAGALDRHDQPRAGGMVEDPGEQLGIAGAVVADRACGDRCPGGMGDLHLMGVAVGVDTDEASTSSASMGTGLFLPRGELGNIGTGLGRSHRAAHL
jgi:hypothetical protein